MRAKVQRWGSSLAVRIPKPVVLEVGIHVDADMEMSVEGGNLVLAPARSRYTLAELVQGITAKNRHEEIDFGPPVGRELL
jgi:antitoxin MazE